MGRFELSAFLKTLEKPTPPVTSQPVKQQRKRGKTNRNLTAPTPTPTPTPKTPGSKKRKKPIPAALREQVWIHKMGRVFEAKCPVTWCQNTITVFDFQSGHNIPESRGGKTDLGNLIPVCSRCNLSMGNEYTIDEWSKISELPVKVVEPVVQKKKWWCF